MKINMEIKLELNLQQDTVKKIIQKFQRKENKAALNWIHLRKKQTGDQSA